MSKEENRNVSDAFNADNADFLPSSILLVHSDQCVEERRNVKLLISYTDYLLYFIAPPPPTILMDTYTVTPITTHQHK